ncbi:MAG: hypothetical protein HQ541_21185 [Mariniphaga sp.]|nr:hypothetical protein [Mariniphaga sp.]
MNDKKIIRPQLLSAFCILTFIGSGIAFLGYFLASLFFEKTEVLIIKYSSWHSVESISPLFFTILMALHCISLVGAIRIWKFHRDGFFIYSTVQLFILFFPTLWIGWTAFSVTNAIFTAIFILGYLFHLKNLK